MTTQRVRARARLKRPNLERVVVGAADQRRIVHLQTSNDVRVAQQCHFAGDARPRRMHLGQVPYLDCVIGRAAVESIY